MYMENMLLQYGLVFVVSMVPFIEAFFTVPAAIIFFDLPPFVVLIVAISGNALSILLFMSFGTHINKFVNVIYYKKYQTTITVNPRIKRSFDRFGATSVCFLSPVLFSSQIGAGAMTGLGASKRHVFTWTSAAISTLALVMAIMSIIAEGYISSLLNLH